MFIQESQWMAIDIWLVFSNLPLSNLDFQLILKI